MKTLKYLIIGAGISGIAACTGTTKKEQQDSAAVNLEIKQGAPLAPADWQCYNVQTEKVCIPKTWTIVQQDQLLLLSDLSAISKGAYFVVLKYNKKLTGYTLDSYLKKIYNELKTDTARSLASYDVVRISYPDKQMISGQYKTVSTGGLFITYSTIFEKENDLYELALKVRQADTKLVADRYKEIIFNFYSKGKLLFTAEDQIKNVEKLDLTKL